MSNILDGDRDSCHYEILSKDERFIFWNGDTVNGKPRTLRQFYVSRTGISCYSGGICLLSCDVELTEELSVFPRSIRVFHFRLMEYLGRLNSHLVQLKSRNSGINNGRQNCAESVPGYFLLSGVLAFCLSPILLFRYLVKCDFGANALWVGFIAFLLGVYGVAILGEYFLDRIQALDDSCEGVSGRHGFDTVTHKYLLTSLNYCNTVTSIGRTQMANVLPMEKQVAVISALAEGTGIRQTERITGVNRETVMNLGVRVGKGCIALLDQKMRGLSCRNLQFDEIWGFIGKKERHLRPDDNPELGDVWTFCAIDSDTKIVPSFKVGKRDSATANAFVADVASRMAGRVQISADALGAYVNAIENVYGADVDFAQIIKTYWTDDSIIAERKFSAPEVVTTEKKRVSGFPDMRKASTSHIERLNGTTRLHMRRLTRLTYAFSKKRENFEAAVGLHFAYYNFVKRHNTLRVTPAMEAGIERDFWTVGDLVKVAA
jgi:IS1 family transposase